MQVSGSPAQNPVNCKAAQAMLTETSGTKTRSVELVTFAYQDQWCNSWQCVMLAPLSGMLIVSRHQPCQGHCCHRQQRIAAGALLTSRSARPLHSGQLWNAPSVVLLVCLLLSLSCCGKPQSLMTSCPAAFAIILC